VKRTPKLLLYGVAAAVLFLLALVLGRPQIAALGAPFALVLVLGLAAPRPGAAEVSLDVTRTRAMECEEVEAELVIRASAAIPSLQLAFSVPTGLRLVEGASLLTLKVRAGEERRVPVRLGCDRWGAYRLGDVVWRSSDGAGLRVVDGIVRGQSVLRVYPRVEGLRSSIKPLETQPFAGNRVARAQGEGIEFADVRAYVPGDRIRRVNWRASSLHQTLYVNEEHPERNSDVIVFLDSFAEVKDVDWGTHDLAVRAASSLVTHYLSTRDRVGLVSFGGVVRWLAPSSADIQRYRIVEALLETQIALSFGWKDIDVLPRRSLTPHALIIALTPLLDERGVHALVDLRRRGFDLVVVEISPAVFAASDQSPFDLLAARFWRLERDTMRFRLEELGVAAVQWDGRTPLAAVVEGVRTFRRFARYASG
jgi:uncharacterized protein (DUF58 family)